MSDLDERVAREVMGLDREAMGVKGIIFIKCHANGKPIPNVGIPHYSTDISAAWLVVERMRDAGWNYRIGGGFTPNTHECQFSDPSGYGRGAASMCSSAPEAICRAALEAVGR